VLWQTVAFGSGVYLLYEYQGDLWVRGGFERALAIGKQRDAPDDFIIFDPGSGGWEFRDLILRRSCQPI